MQPHNMKDSLAKSHAAEDLPVWEEVYKKAFPDMAAMVNHRHDGPHQRAGIDRSVICQNSKQILIDEKVRYRNKKTNVVYTDIALEYLSDRDRKVLGWVCKPLLADYIAYAIAPLGVCYLFPVIQLQEAWRRHGEAWKGQYCKPKPIQAYNEDTFTGRKWVTVSVGVPSHVIFNAIGQCLRFSFVAFEDTVDRSEMGNKIKDKHQRNMCQQDMFYEANKGVS